MAEDNGYAYVVSGCADETFIIYIIDIDPVDDAYVVNSLALGGGYISGIKADSGYVYLTLSGLMNGKLAIIDVDPPETAYVVKVKGVDGGWSHAGAGNLFVENGYAYIPNNSIGLVIYDVDPPELLHRISKVALPDYGIEVEVKGDYAYVANENGGLRIIKLW